MFAIWEMLRGGMSPVLFVCEMDRFWESLYKAGFQLNVAQSGARV
jgi:hypothetical protein